MRTITGVATSITLFVGWAPRGPTDRALRLTSFADYQRAYGGLDSRSDLGYAVRHFYDNGGADAYILRIADTATARTAACDIDDLHIEASSPGAWANQFSVRLERRPDDATRFSISIIQPSANSAVLETFSNLSMTATDPRFVLSVINGRSAFIDKLTAGSATTPANATVALNATTNGADGTVIGPDDGTFQTALTTAFAVGGFIDRIDLFNIICVPGLIHGPTIAALQKGAHDRRAFLIVDCDDLDTVSGGGRHAGRQDRGGRRELGVLLSLGPGAGSVAAECAAGVPALRLHGRHLRAHRCDARRVEGAGGHRGRPDRRGRPRPSP